MRHSNRIHTTLFTLAAVVAGSSCVSQQRYDEALQSAELYQRSYHDAEQHIAELEAENQRMRDNGTIGGDLVEASSSPYIADIDRRISDLDRMLSGLGQVAGDVTLTAIEGGVAYDVRESVLFDSGSAEVREEGRALLQQLGREIGSHAFGQIWVRGHTDSDPVKQPATQRRFPHGNLQLSAWRAVEVAALLKAAGLPEKGVGVVGLGASQPLVPNTTAENKQLNRRVEIIVLEDAAPRMAGDR